MNINELDELAKEWNRFDADNEYSQSFLELIAAYREAVAALKNCDESSGIPIDVGLIVREQVEKAKRLGVE